MTTRGRLIAMVAMIEMIIVGRSIARTNCRRITLKICIAVSMIIATSLMTRRFDSIANVTTSTRTKLVHCV